MDIKDSLANGITFVGDTVAELAASIAEKNRIRSQLNHIKALIKADSATRDQAYIELGRFFYENLREDASPENEAICAVIDSTSERISKASIKYMELLNLQNETHIRSENAEKLKKVIAERAAAAAEKAKEKGAELGAKAKEKGAELTQKAKEKGAELSEKAKEKSVELGEKAKEKGAELSQKAKDAAEEIKDKVDDTVDDVRERFGAGDDIEDLIAEEQRKIQAAEEAEQPEAPAAEEPEAPAEPAEESPEAFDF